jgi:hypothetical protein
LQFTTVKKLKYKKQWDSIPRQQVIAFFFARSVSANPPLVNIYEICLEGETKGQIQVVLNNIYEDGWMVTFDGKYIHATVPQNGEINDIIYSTDRDSVKILRKRAGSTHTIERIREIHYSSKILNDLKSSRMYSWQKISALQVSFPAG